MISRLKKILIFTSLACAPIVMLNMNQVKASEDVIVGGHIPLCSIHDSLSPLLKTPASFDKDGILETKCPECDFIQEETINAVTEVIVSKDRFVYDGKIKTPTIEINDFEKQKLQEGIDYKVTMSSGRTKIGKYKITIDLQGNYEGTKTLYFTIVPTAPTKVTTTLYGHDDVKVSWNKVSGASGYAIYYKKATDKNYSLLKHTTELSLKKGNLTDGAKYTFKVVPYKEIDKIKYESLSSKTATITTLGKMTKPTVSRGSSSEAKVAPME